MVKCAWCSLWCGVRGVVCMVECVWWSMVECTVYGIVYTVDVMKGAPERLTRSKCSQLECRQCCRSIHCLPCADSVSQCSRSINCVAGSDVLCHHFVRSSFLDSIYQWIYLPMYSIYQWILSTNGFYLPMDSIYQWILSTNGFYLPMDSIY
jgi:hypothetical protein